MEVSSSKYHEFLAEIKSKGISTFERGGDYHSGYDIETLTFHNKEPVTLAFMDCSVHSGGYNIYPDSLERLNC